MTPDDAVAERLEQLAVEIRRQGRAAIGAQAAAESCLEELRHLRAASDGDNEPVLALLRALVPAFDALDRAAAQARGAAARARSAGTLARLVSRGEDRTLGALAEGLDLLRQQVAAALGDCDVRVDHPSGRPDAARHRVVEVRPAAGTAAGVIVEVVRPGYVAGSRVVREAEVIVAGPRSGA